MAEKRNFIREKTQNRWTTLSLSGQVSVRLTVMVPFPAGDLFVKTSGRVSFLLDTTCKKTVNKEKLGTACWRAVDMCNTAACGHKTPETARSKHPVSVYAETAQQLLISNAHSWSPTCITGVCFYTTVCFQCVSLINETYNPSIKLNDRNLNIQHDDWKRTPT